ncbi:hypothetical protein B0H19DRAFT_1250811 [Mycena capillaripes]|nr:hypothetical protein B0H19DRAFT_1250811 [Mycena capillaripes]
MLDETVSYSNQNPDALKKFETQILSEFPLLHNYEEQWPLRIFISARLKYTRTRSISKPKAAARSRMLLLHFDLPPNVSRLAGAVSTVCFTLWPSSSLTAQCLTLGGPPLVVPSPL